jgi:hypothetical protein
MKKKKLSKEDLLKKIETFSNQNENCTLIQVGTLKDDHDSFLMIKRKDLTTTKTLEGNIFQPYERVEDKGYVVCFILTFSNKNLPKSFKKYVDMGCEVLMLDPNIDKRGLLMACESI